MVTRLLQRHGAHPASAHPLPALLVCFALAACLKLLLLAVDPTVRLFLGDSGSYLHAALTDWVPPDRSFFYPYIIRWSALATASVTSLAVVQSLFGALSATLLFAVLRHGWHTSTRLATVTALLFALEPGQLFYERMMMAESAGQLALTLQLCTLLLYARHGSIGWIPLYVGFGVLAVAFRLSLLPTVLALGVLAPLVRMLTHRQRIDPGRPLVAGARLAAHLAVALLATALLHGQYQQLYGRVADTEPAYIADTGMMRLGLVAPLVRPHHLVRAGVDPVLLAELGRSLTDHRQREAHIWVEDGLFAVLQRHAADPERAARKISIRAAREQPLGLVRLGLLTLADYFDPAVAGDRLQSDIGREPFNDGLVDALRTHLRYEAAAVPASNGIATRYFERSRWWLTACLFALAPLSLAMLQLRWRQPGQRDVSLILCLASLGLVASHVLFSHIVSFRYLHPLPWLVLANVALLVDHVARRRVDRTARGSG